MTSIIQFRTRREVLRRVSKLASFALFVVAACSLSALAQDAGPRPASEPVKTTAPASETSKPDSEIPQRFEKEGVRVEFSVRAAGSDTASAKEHAGSQPARGTEPQTVTFRVTDARTGQPIRGLHPNAWVSARKSERVPNLAECTDKVRTFLGGLLSVRPDADLNSFSLLTINHDNTISVINPEVSFSITKLESLIVLPGRGEDWTLSRNNEFLYVTLPGNSSVAVIDTVSKKLVKTIPTGAGSKPSRIALQPGGRYVWAGLDDSSSVVAIDTASNTLAATVPVGEGLHTLAFADGGRFVYVTNSKADTVTAIDTATLRKAAEIAVSKTPVAIAYSEASRLIYAAGINGATIEVIDPRKHLVVGSIPAKRGIVALRFEPEGRFALAVNQIENTISIVDAATNSITASTEVVKGPDQVAFTRSFAYVRGTESEKFSLIDLGQVRRGQLAPVDVAAGQAPPSASPEDIGVADMIAPTPEGNAAMIANAPDANIYYYTEGMMAPMGTLSNYKRKPRAMMILDRSLSEVAPGVYTAPVKLTRAGRFDVPFLIDQPRLVNCFSLELEKTEETANAIAGVTTHAEALFDPKRVTSGSQTKVRFKLTDALTGEPLEGLRDALFVAFEPPGVWQQRQWARALGGGVYETTQVFPRKGLYKVMLQIPSRGVHLADLPATIITVESGDKLADATTPSGGNK